MRIPAYGLVIGVSMTLLGDLPAELSPVAPQILQGGALVILSWVVWYLLARTFPNHTAAMASQRDAFLAYLKERDSKEREQESDE